MVSLCWMYVGYFSRCFSILFYFGRGVPTAPHRLVNVWNKCLKGRQPRVLCHKARLTTRSSKGEEHRHQTNVHLFFQHCRTPAFLWSGSVSWCFPFLESILKNEPQTRVSGKSIECWKKPALCWHQWFPHSSEGGLQHGSLQDTTSFDVQAGTILSHCLSNESGIVLNLTASFQPSDPTILF